MPVITDIIDKYLKELKDVYADFDENFDQIKKAVDLAKIAHEWQFRKYSGKPYIAHPLRVAVMVAKKCDDLDLILAAILHDTVEDAPEKISMKMIYEEFWEEVWYLVDSVTDNINYFLNDTNKIFDDKIEKLLYWWIKDIRCLLLKISDREHNLKTIQWLKETKQIRMWFETQAIYEPLKKIMNCGDVNFTIEDRWDFFKYYMKDNKLKTATELRENLYSSTFKDFDDDTFELVYKNTDHIIRKIEDRDMYMKLIDTHSFDDKIDVLSIEWSLDGDFLCTFMYKKWKIFDEIDSKIGIQDSYFNIN